MQCQSILIVEDDDGIRDALSLSLKLEGYEVSSARNGKEGLDILSHNPSPCLILLDLMMPVMNGWEFVEALKKDSDLVSIPVVIVSAFTDEAKNIQSQGILKKPVDIESLFNIAEKWCSHKKPVLVNQLL